MFLIVDFPIFCSFSRRPEMGEIGLILMISDTFRVHFFWTKTAIINAIDDPKRGERTVLTQSA
jgi:hypothetical protein